MPVGTMGIGVDQADNVVQYTPPGTSVVDQGNTISNGIYQQVQAGEQVTVEGVIQIPGGSGAFEATGPVTWRTVTITMPT